MTCRPNRNLAFHTIILLAAVCAPASAEEVRVDDPAAWRIGMSAAFEGPAEALGNGMRTGILAYFDAVNDRGGVHGRPLELIALNDSYEPSRTAPNMRSLIDEHEVMCVIGNVGTPTAAVAVPIVNEKRVPMFGAFTGAGLLRKTPPDRYVINYRASYAEEIAQMIRGLTVDLGIAPSEIGFFTQNDAYGDAGWDGGVAALQAMGFEEAEFLPHGRYERNSLNIEDGLSRLMDPRESIKAVLMVGAYKPCAKFIRTARSHGFNPLFLNVSFVGSDALIQEMGSWGEGVIITQVVPAVDGNTAAAIEFRELLAPEKRSLVSFEGFLVAKGCVAGLEIAGEAATREDFVDAFDGSHPIDLGLGVTHRLSPLEHQLSHRVWPTQVHDGRLVPVVDWQDALVAGDSWVSGQ